jgi:hypothetical protein
MTSYSTWDVRGISIHSLFVQVRLQVSMMFPALCEIEQQLLLHKTMRCDLCADRYRTELGARGLSAGSISCESTHSSR